MPFRAVEIELNRARISAYNLQIQIWAAAGVTNRFVSEAGPGTGQDSARRARGINAQGYLGVLLAQELAEIRRLE